MLDSGSSNKDAGVNSRSFNVQQKLLWRLVLFFQRALWAGLVSKSRRGTSEGWWRTWLSSGFNLPVSISHDQDCSK
jgi:hypothetical protein